MSKLLPVTKVVDEYSAEELMKFREQFAPVAQRRNQLTRRFTIFMALDGFCLFIFLIVVIAAVVVMHPENRQEWLEWLWVIPALGGILLQVGFVIFFIFMTRLVRCPACHNSLSSRGSYCPDCGSNQLETGKWFKFPQCHACGKRLVSGRGGRSFKIRACTHCGVLLDEKGF